MKIKSSSVQNGKIIIQLIIIGYQKIILVGLFIGISILAGLVIFLKKLNPKLNLKHKYLISKNFKMITFKMAEINNLMDKMRYPEARVILFEIKDEFESPINTEIDRLISDSMQICDINIMFIEKRDFYERMVLSGKFEKFYEDSLGLIQEISLPDYNKCINPVLKSQILKLFQLVANERE